MDPSYEAFVKLDAAGARRFMKWYWDSVSGDSLPPAVAIFASDYHFNTGGNAAGGIFGVARLQLVLNRLTGKGLAVDGFMGPHTLAEANAVKPAVLLDAYAAERFVHLRQIVGGDPPQAAFITGWRNRVADMQRLAASYL
jgi:lysozyme family protein